MKSIPGFILCMITASWLHAQAGVEIKTIHGFRFINHTDKKSTKPLFEDDIVADVQVYVGDSLMQDSKSFAPDGLTLTLPSKQEFESSPSAPALMDAALLMGIGDSATAYMKIDSFIKVSLPLRLRKFDDVRYEIKLVNVIGGEAKRAITEKKQAAFTVISKSVSTTVADYRNGDLKTRLTKLPSGLKYLVVEEGKGIPVQSGEQVAVHYYGCLTDGSMFDTSLNGGEPLAFPVGVGQMIPGFDEGVSVLKHGSKAYLFLPPALAYGDQENGAIPANSELIFYIEIQ
jgi:FKBP-type peptidyl-prolyl cis-trans isomerase FkpA